MKLQFSLAVLVSSLVLAPPIFAKAPTALVTVTGPRLQQPLQLADEWGEALHAAPSAH